MRFTIREAIVNAQWQWEVSVPLWTETESIPAVKRGENSEWEWLSLKEQSLSPLLWWKFKSACHYSDATKSGSVLFSWWYAISASFILIASPPGDRKSALCQYPHDICIPTLIIPFINLCFCNIESTANVCTKVKLDRLIHLSTKKTLVDLHPGALWILVLQQENHFLSHVLI